MYPARGRGRRTGDSAVVAPRTVTAAAVSASAAAAAAGGGQVWVSCWMLLWATCILGARAQGRLRCFIIYLILRGVCECVFGRTVLDVGCWGGKKSKGAVRGRKCPRNDVFMNLIFTIVCFCHC